MGLFFFAFFEKFFVPILTSGGLAAVSSSAFAALYSAFGKYDVVHIHAEGPAFFAWLPKMFGKRVVVVGYFVANCLSFASTDLYLLIKLKIWKVISWKPENRSLKKEMVAYSVPMGLGNIGWWINNVSDRYIVTWICGLAANGVYSVAYKIPSLLSMFQQIFNQAWTISAVKEYDQDRRCDC